MSNGACGVLVKRVVLGVSRKEKSSPRRLDQKEKRQGERKGKGEHSWWYQPMQKVFSSFLFPLSPFSFLFPLSSFSFCANLCNISLSHFFFFSSFSKLLCISSALPSLLLPSLPVLIFLPLFSFYILYTRK
jgi:hypothetical protein